MTAEVAVAEPAPAEAPPAETADQALRREARAQAQDEGEALERREPRRRSRAARSVPAANNDTADEIGPDEPRRGWWQRTFG